MTSDEKYMRLALTLAKNGAAGASPNPMVGAVLVKRGTIVGKGYHKKAGGPHAEINAIADAGKKARGATLYLNLEPCCHFGKTPPCIDAVVKAGIKKVVAGMVDPNPMVSGKGIELLKKKGIEVTVGVLEEECRRLNESFIKRVSTGRPFVILKAAVSLDGKVATRRLESKWITSETSRIQVHRLRDRVDAVMTGIGTVLADDPLLTPRAGRATKVPLRVIVDSSLRTPDSANVVGPNTLFAATEHAPAERMEALESRGADVQMFMSRAGRVDLSHLMDYLGNRGINTLLVEAGPELSAALFAEGLVDKVLFFYAPLIIGGMEAPGVVGGIGIDRLADAISLRDVKLRRVDKDFLIEGYVHRDR